MWIGTSELRYNLLFPLSPKTKIKPTIEALCHLSPEPFNLWCDDDNDVVALVCDNCFGTLKAGLTQSIQYTLGIGWTPYQKW